MSPLFLGLGDTESESRHIRGSSFVVGSADCLSAPTSLSACQLGRLSKKFRPMDFDFPEFCKIVFLLRLHKLVISTAYQGTTVSDG